MLPTTIETYGGPYVDEETVSNPESQISADKDNRALEDMAQTTRTVPRAWVEFKTNTSTNPPAGDVTHTGVWGSGSAQKPAVTRNGTGDYTVTWATSYSDGLGESEDVSFQFHTRPSVRADDANLYDAKVRSLTANTVRIIVFNSANPPVLSDLSGTAFVSISLR